MYFIKQINYPNLQDSFALRVNELLDLRKQARINKNFNKADIIRDKLKCIGITIEDKKNNDSKWTFEKVKQINLDNEPLGAFIKALLKDIKISYRDSFEGCASTASDRETYNKYLKSIFVALHLDIESNNNEFALNYYKRLDGTKVDNYYGDDEIPQGWIDVETKK